MTLWAIADLHASKLDPNTGLPSKPMDEFGPRWVDHIGRLESAWEQAVGPRDTVVIVGDIDWALRLEDAASTLDRIHEWNGGKLLVRGNHDYWWSSKATSKVRRMLPSSIRLLHNDSVMVDDVNVCGSKGSPIPGGIGWTPDDEKLLRRELVRLRLSLEAREPDLHTVVAMHYPPFFPRHPISPYKELLEEYEVTSCLYGHLHGDAAESGPKGSIGNINYYLVAGDFLDFQPVPVWDGGPVTDWPQVRNSA